MPSATPPACVCLAKPGDYVEAGQPILELRADDPGRFAAAIEALDAADVITIGSEPPPEVPLVLDDVGAQSS